MVEIAENYLRRKLDHQRARLQEQNAEKKKRVDLQLYTTYRRL
jgi:hypothetical protein